MYLHALTGTAEFSRPKDCQEFRICYDPQILAVELPDYTNPEVPEVYATFSVPLNLVQKNKTSLRRLFRKYSATLAVSFKPLPTLASTSETWRRDKGMTPLFGFQSKYGNY